MKQYIQLLILIFFLPLGADNVREVVFVSLGSHCEVSMKLSENHLRYFSTPIDWMLTQDHEGVAKLIDNRFEHALDAEYLVMDPRGFVYNTIYHIDFRHDWPDTDLLKHLPDIREKYERRINRFYNLSELSHRVVFIRSAYDKQLNVANNMPFATPESWIITTEQARELRDVLERQFPATDFLLVVVNYDDTNVNVEVSRNVIEHKVRKAHKSEDYKVLVDLLKNPENYDAIKENLKNQE